MFLTVVATLLTIRTLRLQNGMLCALNLLTIIFIIHKRLEAGEFIGILEDSKKASSNALVDTKIDCVC